MLCEKLRKGLIGRLLGILLVGSFIVGCGEPVHTELYEEGSTDCGSALEEDFETLLEPVFAATCIDCHSEGGNASFTNFIVDPSHSIQERIQSVVGVSDISDPENSPLLTKPTNQVYHGGNQQVSFTTTSQEYLDMKAFIDLLAADLNCN